MIYIAHRGNVNGPISNLENRPEYIQKALDKGFYVELDVWVNDDKVTLGHDKGMYPCELSFLANEKIICHAKNFEAVEVFNSRKDIHWFWHDKDLCTLTSRCLIWAYPHNIIERSILNQPEYNQKGNIEEVISQYNWYKNNYKFIGVCSDYVDVFMKLKV